MIKCISKICAAILLLCLTGCAYTYTQEVTRYAGLEETDEIRVYMEDDTISTDAESFTYYVENLSDEITTYGESWVLEMFYQGEWQMIYMYSDKSGYDVFEYQRAILIAPGETKKDTFSFKYYPYHFVSGTYRIIQRYTSKTVVICEFQMVD